MTEEPVAIPSRRRGLTLVSVVLGLVIMIVLTMYWAWPLFQSTKTFEEPKLTTVHLDELPFMRLELKAGESYRPLEVMAGTTVLFKCEVVARSPEPPRFVLKAFGKTVEGRGCQFDVTVPRQPGLRDDFEVTYYDGGTSTPTDSMNVPVLIVPAFEGIEFQALEDAAHQPAQPGSVPDQVYVFARAIAKLPGDGRDFVALFFTADPSNGVPVLELAPVKEGDKPEPMTGSVVRYRSYGPDLAGYAFWSLQPVRIGGREGNRAVTDIYTGIFRRDELPKLLDRLLKIDVTGADTLTVTPLVRDAAELRALTVDGRLLSTSLHAVRGPGPSTGNEARVPPPIVNPPPPR